MEYKSKVSAKSDEELVIILSAKAGQNEAAQSM